MRSLKYYFIFGIIAGIIILIVAHLLIKYDQKVRISDFKKLVAENKRSNESMIFHLLNQMSFKEIDLLSTEIKNFLKRKFIVNLSAYKEGVALIDTRIDSPERREKIIALLDQLIYEKTKIPFLTKAGVTMAKQFKAEEVRVDLNFLQTPSLKKECYIN